MPKTNAECAREYRKRKRERNLINIRNKPIKKAKTDAERAREYRRRKKQAQLLSNASSEVHLIEQEREKNMDPTMLKIKKEFVDLPEDSPDLLDGEQIKLLAEDSAKNCSLENSLHNLHVKTEFKEEPGDCFPGDRLGHDEVEDEQMNEVSKLKEEKQVKRRESKNKVKCEQCGTLCRDNNVYKLHLMNHTGERPFKCDLCDKTYKKAKDLDYHTISHTGKHEHHCEICGKGFVVPSALKAHARTHTKDKPYICPICGRGFSHCSSLRPHIAIHGVDCPFACDRCDRTFKTKKALLHHTQNHDFEEGKGLQCGICFKIYKSKESIRVHLRVHRQKDTTEQSLHPCGQCGKTYKHLVSLKNHMRYHTNDLFKCHMCDKSYVERNHLRIHLRNHTGETPYACEVCNRKFHRKDSYDYHKGTHESDRKTYKCDMCDRELLSKSSLRAHQTLIHSTERKHQCQVCGERFKLRYELTKHCRKRKHGETRTNHRAGQENAAKLEPDTAKCEICPKECAVDEPETHVSSHDVKPIVCECGELFHVEGKYKKHLRECEVVGRVLETVTEGVQVAVKSEITSNEVIIKECFD